MTVQLLQDSPLVYRVDVVGTELRLYWLHVTSPSGEAALDFYAGLPPRSASAPPDMLKVDRLRPWDRTLDRFMWYLDKPLVASAHPMLALAVKRESPLVTILPTLPSTAAGLQDRVLITDYIQRKDTVQRQLLRKLAGACSLVIEVEFLNASARYLSTIEGVYANVWKLHLTWWTGTKMQVFADSLRLNKRPLAFSI